MLFRSHISGGICHTDKVIAAVGESCHCNSGLPLVLLRDGGQAAAAVVDIDFVPVRVFGGCQIVTGERPFIPIVVGHEVGVGAGTLYLQAQTILVVIIGGIFGAVLAAQKKALTAQAEEISHTVLELERKISGSDDSGNAVIEQFKSYAGITALTKEISTELLQSVTIYPDGRMDIRLNLADEIKALMETLRQESYTA